MKATIHIEMDNAAFEDDPGVELARILRETARKIEEGYWAGQCYDINGNQVGNFDIAEEG